MNDKITMIELFSGIGSQERALRQLNVPYEVVYTCDCDANAILFYAAMRYDLEKESHNFDFPSQEQMIAELQSRNIGYDFTKSKHTINKRTPIEKLKNYYLSHKLTNNLGDISMVEQLPYADIVTYSSPCQSFSVAGKLAGAKKNCKTCGHQWEIDFSNPDYNYKCPNCGNVNLESTTSGLLQEVQRLLSIAYNDGTLSKYLLLENVKNLVMSKFKPQFDDWVKWLDGIGYNAYWKILNAKQFGIPQSRERVFAVSIRKDVDDGTFQFPQEILLDKRLRHILEQEVDERYYLSETIIEKYKEQISIPLKRGYSVDVTNNEPDTTEIDPIGNYSKSNYNATQIINKNGIAPTMRENHGQVTAILESFVIASHRRDKENGSIYQKSVQKDNYIVEPKIIEDFYKSRELRVYEEAAPTLRSERIGLKVLESDTDCIYRIRKLTSKEAWRLQGFSDKDHDNAAEYVSQSALYKQAGNTIYTGCLIALFNSLFLNDVSDSYKDMLIDYNN